MMKDRLSEVKSTPEEDAPEQQFVVRQTLLGEFRLDIRTPPYQISAENQSDWRPKIDTEFKVNNKPLEGDQHLVTIGLALTAKTQAGQTLYQIDVEQQGIFNVVGYEGNELGLLLGGYAPSLLYPELRARVNESLMYAGYPPAINQPMDFVNIFRQQMAQADQKPEEMSEVEDSLNH